MHLLKTINRYPIILGIICGFLNSIQQSQKIFFVLIQQDLHISKTITSLLFGFPNLCLGSLTALILMYFFNGKKWLSIEILSFFCCLIVILLSLSKNFIFFLYVTTCMELLNFY